VNTFCGAPRPGGEGGCDPKAATGPRSSRYSRMRHNCLKAVQQLGAEGVDVELEIDLISLKSLSNLRDDRPRSIRKTHKVNGVVEECMKTRRHRVLE